MAEPPREDYPIIALTTRRKGHRMGKHESLLGASALCSIRVKGLTYAQMENDARAHAARFFGTDPENLIVVDPPHIVVVSYASFQDHDVPELWEGVFQVGVFWNDAVHQGKDADDE
jgi:hypothetical protein